MGKSKKGNRKECMYDSEPEDNGLIFNHKTQLDLEEGCSAEEEEYDNEVPEQLFEQYDRNNADSRTNCIIHDVPVIGAVAHDSAEKWRTLGGNTLKTLSHFSYALLDRALAANFDTDQVADLLSLIIPEMGYQKDLDGVLKLLEKVSVSPEMLAALKDRGLDLPASTVLSLLLSLSGDSTDKFIKYIGDALEMDVLNVHCDVAANEDLFSVMSSFFVQQRSFDQFHKKCLAATVCAQLPHKKHCARFLHHLTHALPTPRDRARFISKVITKEYFRDVLGKMKDFKAMLPVEVAEQLEILLGLDFEVDSEGELLESDADSEGNLRGFIVHDCSDEGKKKRKGNNAGGKGTQDSGSEEEEEFDENDSDSSYYEDEEESSASQCEEDEVQDYIIPANNNPRKTGKETKRVNLNESSDEDTPTSNNKEVDHAQPGKRRKILDLTD